MSYIDGDRVVSLYGSMLFKSAPLRGQIVVAIVPKLNVKCLIYTIQQFVLNMSLFFVHTARHSIRLIRLISDDFS